MTGQNVIDRAWEMFQDTETTKRNPVATMVPMLNDGLRDLLARRPRLRLDSDGSLATLAEVTTVTVDTDTLPVGDEYREALAHYLAHRVFLLDAEDEHNAGLAAWHLKQYTETT